MIKMFVIGNCTECKEARKLYEEIKALGYDIQLHDTETAEGLVLSTFYGVTQVPTLLFKNKEGDIVGWHGRIPEHAEEMVAQMKEFHIEGENK